MNRTVYFADRAVAFTAEAPGGAWYAVAAEACGGISRAKILNFLESHNSVAVVSDDPDRAFAAFAAEFTPVEAAGGSFLPLYDESLPLPRLLLPPEMEARLPEGLDRGQLLSVLWRTGALRPGQVSVQLEETENKGAVPEIRAFCP